MAMLAEPRRKQKWSVDPRNSTWSNDESKFGQKMLERMGWSKGKGLGKSEQGTTEHIKVKKKNNNQGLGTTASHEDNWIAHQDDFNQLLAELNSCHGQKGPPAEQQQQSFSLEEKSKTSKKRVHYMKFTKGKDLSSRSETDLACVFGKRTTRPRDQEGERCGQESLEEQEIGEAEAAVTPDPEEEATVNTVTSSLSVHEYFAQRMAQLKGGHAREAGSHAQEARGHAQDTPTEERTKSKKKKKKRKRERGEEGVERETEAGMEDSAIANGNEEDSAVANGNEEESAVVQKKKRKRADGGMERDESRASRESQEDRSKEPKLCPESLAEEAHTEGSSKLRRKREEEERPIDDGQKTSRKGKKKKRKRKHD